MDIAYHSNEAIEVNKLIFETMYHASLECSNEISINRTDMMQSLNVNNSISTIFTEYPIVRNSVCRDYNYNTDIINKLNECKPIPPEMKLCDKDIAGAYSSFEGSPASNGELQFDMWGVKPTDRYDWEALKKSIRQYGLRN